MGDQPNNSNNNQETQRFQNQRGRQGPRGNQNNQQGRGRGGRGGNRGGGGRFQHNNNNNSHNNNNYNPNWQPPGNNNQWGNDGDMNNWDHNQQFDEQYQQPNVPQGDYYNNDYNQDGYGDGHNNSERSDEGHGNNWNHHEPENYEQQQPQHEALHTPQHNDQVKATGPTQDQQKQWDREDDEDERLFDEQFRKWEDQFNTWKVQNQEHPDRSSYLRYEREFEDVRIRLMERRDQMRQRRLSARKEILMNQAKPQVQPRGNAQHESQPQTSRNYDQPPPPPQETRKEAPWQPDFSKDDDYMDESFDGPIEGGSGDNVFENKGGGIPGLDLVEPTKQKEYFDGEEVINLEEEENAKRRAEEEKAKEEKERQIKDSQATKDKGRERTPERPDKVVFEVDTDNINNILQNPNILSLLNRMKENSVKKPEDVAIPIPAPSVAPTNLNDLVNNPQIQGVLQQVQNSLTGPPPSVQPQAPNISELLQNPNISSLLNQVQSGLMGNNKPQRESRWSQPQQPLTGNNNNYFPQDFDHRAFDGSLPPAFRGNPEALGFVRDGPPPQHFHDNFQGNRPFHGPPPPHMNMNMNMNMQQQQYGNNLPPPVIHGGRRPEWDREQRVNDFGMRRQTDEPILVPTKVVDYQHRSASKEEERLDYFHRKAQADPKPKPQLNPNVFDGRNVFTSRFSGPKRQSRFSDESTSSKMARTAPGNTTREWTSNRPKATPPTKPTYPTKPTTQAKVVPAVKPDDYLEGISDDDMDNNDPVAQEEDNLSLSSVEDVADSRQSKSRTKKQKLFNCVDLGDPNLISIEKLLLNPGRKQRPRKILILIRGLPGSGKTHIAKLVKDKEVEMGGSAPRILSIDDYFTTETDEVVVCPKTGKDINSKSMVYEYEAEMEEQYLQYLLKAYKKTISDGYFDFIILDAVYPKMKDVVDIVSHAKSKGFVVSISVALHSLSDIASILIILFSLMCAHWKPVWKSAWNRTSTAGTRTN